MSAGPARASHGFGEELRILTVNVDGLGNHAQLSDADRMHAILDMALAQSPDIILLQEVVEDMFAVVKRRLQGWKLRRRARHEWPYFIVTAARAPDDSAVFETTSHPFPTSSSGRHVLTVRCNGWAVVNAHAESGRTQEQRAERMEQLEYMSRMHEL